MKFFLWCATFGRFSRLSIFKILISEGWTYGVACQDQWLHMMNMLMVIKNNLQDNGHDCQNIIGSISYLSIGQILVFPIGCTYPPVFVQWQVQECGGQMCHSQFMHLGMIFQHQMPDIDQTLGLNVPLDLEPFQILIKDANTKFQHFWIFKHIQ